MKIAEKTAELLRLFNKLLEDCACDSDTSENQEHYDKMYYDILITISSFRLDLNNLLETYSMQILTIASTLPKDEADWWKSEK